MTNPTTFPDTEAQKKAIETDGCLYLADSAVGIRVGEFAKKGWPRTNVEGLKFLKANTVDDERIVKLLYATLPGSKLGAYILLHPFPSRIFCFLAPRIKERQTLAILIGGRGSKIRLYKCSHKLSVQPASGDLMQLVPEQLAVDSVSPITVDLKEGGYTVFDGRLGFTILEGDPIVLVFALPERLKLWKTLELPNQPELKEMAAEMSHSTIGFNFTFTK
ncbi:MAG: hypothetical protein LQ342_006818 [Letrouitia transgressa]|nr:MAG: hypothetical protein LQ342_006818 [Letrouitia transgressa]